MLPSYFFSCLLFMVFFVLKIHDYVLIFSALSVNAGCEVQDEFVGPLVLGIKVCTGPFAQLQILCSAVLQHLQLLVPTRTSKRNKKKEKRALFFSAWLNKNRAV